MGDEPVVSVADIALLNAAFRTSGLSVDLTSTAVIYDLVGLFKEKQGDMSLKEINAVVEKVLKDPAYAIKKEAQE